MNEDVTSSADVGDVHPGANKKKRKKHHGNGDIIKKPKKKSGVILGGDESFENKLNRAFDIDEK